MKIEYLYPIWFVLCALAGTVMGRLTGRGAIRGLTDGMIIAVLPILLFIMAYAFMMLWRPTLPPCRCRQCNHKSYKYVAPIDGLSAVGPIRFGCPRCGRQYVLHHDRFSELTDDGRTVPYMHHTKWGRWKESKAEQTPGGDVA